MNSGNQTSSTKLRESDGIGRQPFSPSPLFRDDVGRFHFDMGKSLGSFQSRKFNTQLLLYTPL